MERRGRLITRGLDFELGRVDGHVPPRVRLLVRIADGFIRGTPTGVMARANRISKRTVQKKLKELEEIGNFGFEDKCKAL